MFDPSETGKDLASTRYKHIYRDLRKNKTYKASVQTALPFYVAEHKTFPGYCSRRYEDIREGLISLTPDSVE